MKVLYLLDTTNVGGIEALSLDVCRNAAAAGIEMTFVTSKGGELEEKFRSSGVDFIRLERRMPLDLRLVRELRKLIKTKGINVLHAHQAVDGMHGFIASRGTTASVVLSHHGFIHDAKNRMAIKFLMPRVARNLFVSEGLRAWYQSAMRLNSGLRSTVLYNGIDEARLAYSGPSLRDSIGVPDDAFVFGMIANFYVDPRKDQIALVRAFVSFAHSHPLIHLVLIGSIEDGAEQKFAECVRLAKESGLEDRVHFLGRRNDISGILSAMDVFVLSSLHEGMGIAAVEAMLVKKPCIVSDIPPLREVSDDGHAAVIFETGNPKTLADVMRRLAQSESERSLLSERGYRFAHENFSIEAHLKNLSRIYNDVVTAAEIPASPGRG